jgi:hypothetical protein
MISSNYPTHAYLMTFDQWQQYQENKARETSIEDVIIIPPSPEPIIDWPNCHFGD